MARGAALAAALAWLSGASAHAAMHTPVPAAQTAAPAVHTPAPAVHTATSVVHAGTHGRHHALRRGARRLHHPALHPARLERDPGTGHAPEPARRMPRPAEHKAALPTTLHAQRHGGGSSVRHRHAVAAMLVPQALAPTVEIPFIEWRTIVAQPRSLMLSGRAPPRAGPLRAPTLPIEPRPLLTFHPAAPGTSPSTSEARQSLQTPPTSRAFRPCRLSSCIPNRSRWCDSPAGRLEGAAAGIVMPSRRGEV